MDRMLVKLYKIESETEKESILRKLPWDSFERLIECSRHYRKTLESSFNALRCEYLNLQKLKDKEKNPFVKVWWILNGKQKWEEACRKSEYYIKRYEEIVTHGGLWKLVLLESEALMATSPKYNMESNYYCTCSSAISRFLENMNNNVFPFILKESQRRLDQFEK